LGLGAWVVGQRVLNNKGKLLKDRKKKLDKLKFDWKPVQTRWLRNFENYRSLYRMNKGMIPYDDIKLHNFDNWLYSQRMYFEKGKLSATQIAMLKSVKVDLRRKPIPDWDLRFAELTAFKKKYGNFAVFKPTLRKKYKVLGAWVYQQRRKYKAGILSKERFKKLSSIGFDWDGMAAYQLRGIPGRRHHK
jgi:hypothetical protein